MHTFLICKASKKYSHVLPRRACVGDCSAAVNSGIVEAIARGYHEPRVNVSIALSTERRLLRRSVTPLRMCIFNRTSFLYFFVAKTNISVYY